VTVELADVSGLEVGNKVDRNGNLDAEGIYTITSIDNEAGSIVINTPAADLTIENVSTDDLAEGTQVNGQGLPDPNGLYTVTDILPSDSFVISKEVTEQLFVLNAASGNAYTGVTTLEAGILSVSELQDGGIASAIGASSNAAANLVFNGGTLRYTGTGASTDRLFTLSGSGQIEANGTGALVFSSTGNIAGNGALTLSGTSDAALLNTFNPVLSGASSLIKSGSNTWVIGAANHSYSGSTTINGGVLQIGTLANGGVISSIGVSASDAANLVLDNGTLRYTGGAVSTDRLFSVGTGGGTIESAGTGPINFTNDTGSMGLVGLGARTLTLTGSNTGGNTLSAVVGDSDEATSLVKNGPGTWIIGAANTYTGATVVNGGLFQVGTTGSHSTGSGGTTVNNGATLAGVGIIGGTPGTIDTVVPENSFTDGTLHVFNSGAMLAPGDDGGADIGTLTFNGNLALNDGSSSIFQISAATLNGNDISGGLLVQSLNLGGYDSIGGYRDSNFTIWDDTAITAGRHDFILVNGQITLNQHTIVIQDINNYLTQDAQVGDIFNLGNWLDLNSLSSFDAGENYRKGGDGGGNLILPTLGGNLVYDVSLFASHGIILTITKPGEIPVLMNSYNIASGGAWSTTTNWRPSATPNSIGAIVNLTTNITSNAVLTLDGDKKVGTVVIGDQNSSHHFEIAQGTGSGSLIFDNGKYGRALLSKTQSTSTTLGVDVISAPVLLASNLSINVNPGGAAARMDISGTISQ
ncbi:MAG: autotransporter-associated beta strand repeat-containing protein, partial [Gammaproteobacteria bacterium]|nr:autotransporter-associated beta strand repeat-containing protein [Gammaproteobacteria bacterium]